MALVPPSFHVDAGQFNRIIELRIYILKENTCALLSICEMDVNSKALGKF